MLGTGRPISQQRHDRGGPGGQNDRQHDLPGNTQSEVALLEDQQRILEQEAKY